MVKLRVAMEIIVLLYYPYKSASDIDSAFFEPVDHPDAPLPRVDTSSDPWMLRDRGSRERSGA
jgi:hypothetical protein